MSAYNYERGYEAGLSGQYPEHHEGLIFDIDYAEGFADGQTDRTEEDEQ